MRRLGIFVAVAMIMAGINAGTGTGVAGSAVQNAKAAAAVTVPAGVACTRSVRIDPAPSAQEGDPLVFTVTLVTPQGCPVAGTVTFRTRVPVIGGGFDATPGTSPATPKADYISRSGVLEWKPGDPVTKEIPVQTLVDTRDEVAEEVEVCLDRSADIEIPTPCASSTLGSPMCMQAGTTVAFAIGLSVPATEEVTVFYDTVDGTAKEDQDYVGVHNGQARIPRGQLDTIAKVQILPNQQGEGFEYFFVEFRATHDGYTERSRVKVDVMTR
jgi:Calx-beta domain